MTLRDYFAAKAMQVLEWKTSDAPFSSVAKNAYELADAMLKQREQWNTAITSYEKEKK